MKQDAPSPSLDSLPPPIPAYSSRRKRRLNESQSPSTRSSGIPSSSPSTCSDKYDSYRGVAMPPECPEIISSLITSLSAHTLSGKATLSAPVSPIRGSFGVEHGSNRYPVTAPETLAFDDVAAIPPTIRTGLPSSSLSALMAPQPSRKSSGEGSGSFRSLLRHASSSRPSSRPSSTGTDASHHDCPSIGNLSIERNSTKTPDLSRPLSTDSWGRKSGRNSRGLMYMSSKERLRGTSSEPERKHTNASGGAGGGSSVVTSSIVEEPFNPDSSHTTAVALERNLCADQVCQPHFIPPRDSSLRGIWPKRNTPSPRFLQSDRNSDSALPTAIPDTDPFRTLLSQASDARAGTRREQAEHAEMPYSVEPSTLGASQVVEAHRPDGSVVLVNSDDEDGAPFPPIYSSSSISRQCMHERSKSGTAIDAGKTSKTKRNGANPKRMSQGANSQLDSSNSRRGRTPEAQCPEERPGSADSVDDAVESYLCSPRLSQKIKHPQTGRTISFSEVGDPDGSAVFCCVGMGLTRYITAFYDDLAYALKLRLITPDRPGVGGSEPHTDGTSTPLSWPDDVYIICQSLKITKFSILAHSAGAIYALATALRMPQHIRGRIHLLAPWIPPSQMNVFGGSQALPPTNAIPTSQRILRALPTTFLRAANSSFMAATSSSLTTSLPKQKRTKRKPAVVALGRPDKDNVPVPDYPQSVDGREASPSVMENMDPMRPEGSDFYVPATAILDAAADALAVKERQTRYDDSLTYSVWDLATRGANPAVDLLVCLERKNTIGFRYVDITRPVVIHHGSRDNRVPVENVTWLGKTMRRCEVRILEGEGHGLMASAHVMGSVLMEISKEWDEWIRLTGAEKRVGGDRERERGRPRAAAALR